MKLISWNIDSLTLHYLTQHANSQEVLQALVAEDADIIAIQKPSYPQRTY